MDQLYYFIASFYPSSLFGQPGPKVDIVGSLPPEVASIILRKVDNASLMNCLLVHDSWRELVVNDPVLNDRARLSHRVDQTMLHNHLLDVSETGNTRCSNASILPPPKEPKEVNAFQDMVGYYRRFIPNMADRLASWTRLLKKGVKFAVTADMVDKFNGIKEALIHAAVCIDHGC
ncbi:hypothetical protein AAG570_011666 [Ranatra chinensis]|uniref:F-box domain-containing protein n=1 Tax=Ranatra chinensis TaxID=642074 RepID=A0ABD0Z2S2_9HEMI